MKRVHLHFAQAQVSKGAANRRNRAAPLDMPPLRSGYSVSVKLPRFEFRSKVALADALSAMGMPTAFSDAADFAGIDGQRDLHLQQVVHEAYVKVNEAGTEAAAATAVIGGTTGVPEPRAFEATRPFLFAVRDRATGAVVFLGRVVDPSAS